MWKEPFFLVPFVHLYFKNFIFLLGIFEFPGYNRYKKQNNSFFYID